MACLVPDPYRVDVTYELDLGDGPAERFVVDVDLRSEEPWHYSDERQPWCELSFHQCEQCPLPKTEKYCPAALSISDIVERFAARDSSASCTCRVVLPRRTLTLESTVQGSLYPLIGLRLATSQCPFLSELKPMARFHEPFADPYYTVYRATSFYLLKRFFSNRKHGTSDWSLDGLRDIYRQIHTVNVKMAERLRAATSLDAASNCIAILSVFDTSMTYLHERYLDLLAGLFE